VGLLGQLGVDFDTVNVLEDPEIRQGIKDYSDWPTIPQLYIDKEFVGGSDIVRSMAASGELHQMLGLPFEAPKPPTIEVTDAMVAAFQQQAQGDSGNLRIQVGDGFQYGIGIDDKRPGDMEVVSNGITILVDPDSAKRADGMTLDFREGPEGGVVIDNPNEPAQVNQLSVTELKALMDEGTALELFDVRTDEERETAIIEGSRQLTRESMSYLEGLDKGAMIVLHCHHGGRSQQAAEQLRAKGFSNLHNVVGGIDAWSQEIDASVPRY
ncbi:MAG: rhodanese-like domain-containing protein, partial [Myxococcota bacterium]|nr:rhodanese-like domain-containing protein [Myxococcota bacterium]